MITRIVSACLVALLVVTSATVCPAAVDPESPASTPFDLVRNPGIEAVDLVKPDAPADLTLRKLEYTLVEDAGQAFSGKRYLRVTSNGTAWFKFKDTAPEKVPGRLMMSARVRGKGTVKLSVPFRGQRTYLGQAVSESFEIDSNEWTRVQFVGEIPAKFIKGTPEHERAPVPEGKRKNWVDGFSLAVRLTGKIDLDEVHVIDLSAAEKLDAASILPRGRTPRVTCPSTDAEVKLDGVIAQDEWARAAAVTGFSDLAFNLSPRQTVAWMMRRDDKLYFAFRSDAPRRGRKIETMKGTAAHDFKFNHREEYIEIHLQSPEGEAVQIIVNPAGGIMDRKGKDFDWQSRLRTASTFEDSGDTVGGVLTFARQIWTCEVELDIPSLGFGKIDDGTTWAVNFCRDYGVPEGNRQSPDWTTWVKNSDFRDPKMAEMVFSDKAPAVQLLSIGDPASGDLAAVGRVAGPGKVTLEVAAFDAQRPDRLLGRAVGTVDPGDKPQPYRVARKLVDVPQMDADYVAAARGADGKLLMVNVVPFEVSSPFDFAAYYNGAHKQLKLTANMTSLPERMKPVTFRLAIRPEKETTVIQRSELDVAGKTYVEASVDVAKLAPGRYLLEGVLLDKQGKDLIGGSSLFRVYPKQPWVDKIIPLTDEVPEPFTPVTVDGSTVDVILRRYELSSCGLPKSITVMKENILTAAAGLAGRARGRAIDWTWQEPKLLSSNKGQATWRFEGTTDELKLSGTVRVEYDGFARWTATLSPVKTGATIEALAMEFPLRRQDAMYLRAEDAVTDRRYGVALFKEKTTKPLDIAHFYYSEGDWVNTEQFLHTLWVGGDVRGLGLVTDSEQPMRGPKRVEIVKAGDTTTVRYNLVSEKTELTEPLTFDFGYNASPFKPLPTESRRYTSVMSTHNLFDYPDAARQVFVRMMHLAIPNVYYTASKHAPGIIKKGNAYGIVTVPYYGFGIGADRTPEFELFEKEILLKPEHGGEAGTRGAWRCTCPDSTLWRDYVTFKVRNLTEKHDMNGLYLDVTRAAACNNPAHGCGYYDPERNVRIPTVNVFGTREIFKRVYTYYKTRKPEGVIFLHGLDVGAMPYVDVFTQGESWAKTREHAYRDLSPAMYRTIVARTQYGVPFTFYSFHQYNWRGGRYHEPTPAAEIIMMGMQHHNHFNLADRPGVAACDKIWTFTKPFFGSSRFVPYWVDEAPAVTDVDEVFCGSYIKRDEGKAWIFVSNWTWKDASATVSIDVGKLGFKPSRLTLVDPLGSTRQTMDMTDTLRVNVPARNLRALVLEK